MNRNFALAIGIALCLASAAFAQDSDKPLDVRSSVGDLHVGKDADAPAAGLPLYPGARPKHDQNNDPLNLGILTESFGMNWSSPNTSQTMVRRRFWPTTARR